MKLFLSIFTSFLLYSTITIAHGTIYIEGVEHEKGFIDVKIYNSKENFLVEELAIESIRRMASIKEIETVIPGDGWPIFSYGHEALLNLSKQI